MRNMDHLIFETSNSFRNNTAQYLISTSTSIVECGWRRSGRNLARGKFQCPLRWRSPRTSMHWLPMFPMA